MKNVEIFKNRIGKAVNILITTHIHPDADGIGSEISLCMALRTLGKKAMCVNDQELSSRYRYLDPDRVVISQKEFQQQYKNFSIDLFVVTDTNSLDRIGPSMKPLANKAKELLFIDHHPCPQDLKAIHCITSQVAATGELIATLIESLNVPITPKLALPLYTSILIDTNSFRYPTVTSGTHRIIAKLIDSGIDIPTAYNNIYGAKKISYMQMLGTVLSSAQSNNRGDIAWLVLKEEDLKKFDVETDDTLGFINHLLILDNIKIACMFSQMENSIKVSLRSLGQVDVGVIAQALGGGGHNHSAATILKHNDLDRATSETLIKLETMLEKHSKEKIE